MYSIKAVGIDLSKLVFSIHGLDVNDKCKLRKTVKRNKLLDEIAKLPPCIIGMEACSGAHYSAREFTKLGHNVRIMTSKFVIPYRQNEKNDTNDAKHFDSSRSFSAWIGLIALKLIPHLDFLEFSFLSKNTYAQNIRIRIDIKIKA